MESEPRVREAFSLYDSFQREKALDTESTTLSSSRPSISVLDGFGNGKAAGFGFFALELYLANSNGLFFGGAGLNRTSSDLDFKF